MNNAKRLRGRPARREKDNTVKSIIYSIVSEKTFGDIVLGTQNYFVVGDNGEWWKENCKDVEKGVLIIIKILTKRKLSVTGKVDSWGLSDDPIYNTKGTLGNHMVIRLRDVEASPYVMRFAKRYLGEALEARRKRDEERVLKSKIRKAFM